MPKIKNWSRVEPPRLQDVEMQWEIDSKMSTSELYIESGAGRYPVVFQDRDHKIRKVVATGDSLEDAREKAVKYMKNHPKPLVAGGGK